MQIFIQVDSADKDDIIVAELLDLCNTHLPQGVEVLCVSTQIGDLDFDTLEDDLEFEFHIPAES